ncbi:MAG TPA: general secretion pathway protein GspB, partial [Burkholderiales bacterium]|nr:general secretion pathway protein GspB [Burkholderiales bacterium]
MSFILDALRKSDQQRQRGAPPTLRSAQLMSAPPREPRAAWIYAVLAVVLAAAAFTIGWLRPWQTESPVIQAGPVAPQTGDAKPGEPMIPTRAVVAQAPAELSPSQQSSVAPDVQARDASPPKHEAVGTAKTDTPHSATARSAESPRRTREKPVETVKPAPAQEEKAVPLAELPAAIRQELPQMTITVHAYSRTPKDRLVGVNDKLLHEGESFSSDLVLERITSDGMIFNYKGTRF